jgi:hypothetical protein
MRIIRGVLDQDTQSFCKELVLVPLDDTDTPAYATLFLDDFQRLMAGGVSDVWWINKDKLVVCHASLSNRNASVARLITDAGPGEKLKYLDGDTRNLKSTNLQKSYSKTATRREWDFIAPNNHNTKPRCKYVPEYSLQLRQSRWQQALQSQEQTRQAEIASFKQSLKQAMGGYIPSVI